MASTPRALSHKLKGIADTWINDPFRPNLQLRTVLQSLSTHPRLTPEAVKAARALRNNDIQKNYPLSHKILQPASMPHYYDRLAEAFEKSAQGIRRPWWKVFFGVW